MKNILICITVIFLLCSCATNETTMRAEIKSTIVAEQAELLQSEMRQITRKAYYQGWYNHCIVEAENIDGTPLATMDAVNICTKILEKAIEIKIYENRNEKFPPLPNIPLGKDPTETPVPRGFFPKLFTPPQPVAFVLAGQSNMVLMQDRLETQLKAAYGQNSRVIKCAVSGSSITIWQRGQPAYDNCVAKTAQATQDGYRVVAILWMQGETDVVHKMPATTYRAKFIKFVGDFRVDVSRPGLPIIYAQLGPTYRNYGPWWNPIRDVQKNIVKPGFYTFDTMDIPRIPDNLHYNSYGYAKLSARFMATLQKIYPY